MRIVGQLLFALRAKAAAQFRARLLTCPADAGIDKLQQTAAESVCGLPKRGNHGIASQPNLGILFDIVEGVRRICPCVDGNHFKVA